MKKIKETLDKYTILILWLVLIIALMQNAMIDCCFIMLMIINENIEKIRKGK